MSKSKSESDANFLLQNDHETVNVLFERFGETASSSEMAEIITAAIEELKIHRTIEEEILHPAIRKKVGKRRKYKAPAMAFVYLFE